MPISEKAFTKRAAEEELQKLRKFLGPDGVTADAAVWETSFVYLEGWYLKRQALEAKKTRQEPQTIEAFCSFLKDRAYVRH